MKINSVELTLANAHPFVQVSGFWVGLSDWVCPTPAEEWRREESPQRLTHRAILI